jgi:polyketide biosynthesis enoyl-CoA hydratase PksH
MDRPAAGNALTMGLVEALISAVDLAEADPSCRALVLDSSADSFCLGLELARGAGSADRPDGAVFWRMLNRLRTASVVTVAVVDGPAIGGGVGLACACDLVVVGDAASFRLTELLLGLVPGLMFPFLAARVGEQYAHRMALLAETVRAGEALRAGLADVHVPDAPDGARQILVALRRTDRVTLAEFKALRRRLSPLADDRYGRHAAQLLRRRLDDPTVQNRIARLGREGMLP